METNNSKGSKRDGSYQWSITSRDNEILTDLSSFNKTVSKITLTHNGTKTKKPTSFVVQFSWYKKPGEVVKTQCKRGLGCNWNKSELHQAKERTRVISMKLQDKSFNWEWFDEYVKGIEQVDELQQKLNTPLGELIAEFKASKGDIKSTSWEARYQTPFNKLLNLPNGTRLTQEKHEHWEQLKDKAIAQIYSQPLTVKQVKQVLDSTEHSNYTKQMFSLAITTLLKHHGIYEPFAKLLDNPSKVYKWTPKERYIPSDSEIIYHYENSFEIKRGAGITQEILNNVPNWKFTYGLMATYGMRVHEVFKICNWDKPVQLKAGKWVVVDEADNEVVQQGDLVIPTFNDPSNTKHWLAISHDTKTGYRVAMPLSPAGDDWIERFNLKGKLRLPNMELGKNGAVYKTKEDEEEAKTKLISDKFGKTIKQFNTHCLRHAFNARGRVLNISVPTLALSLGHSENMNSTTYVKHMGMVTKTQLLEQAQNLANEQAKLTKSEAMLKVKELAAGEHSKLVLLEELIQEIYS